MFGDSDSLPLHVRQPVYDAFSQLKSCAYQIELVFAAPNDAIVDELEQLERFPAYHVLGGTAGWPQELLGRAGAVRGRRNMCSLAASGFLLVVLLVTLAEVAADTFRSPSGSRAHAIAKFGRDLRYVELSLWVVVLAVFSFYRIPAARNLKALISGYGFYITMSVVNLAFVFQPENRFSSIARQLPSLAYVITLTIWCAGLWSRFPEPGPPAEDRIERDYRVLEIRTRAIFRRIKSFLERFFRR